MQNFIRVWVGFLSYQIRREKWFSAENTLKSWKRFFVGSDTIGNHGHRHFSSCNFYWFNVNFKLLNHVNVVRNNLNHDIFKHLHTDIGRCVRRPVKLCYTRDQKIPGRKIMNEETITWSVATIVFLMNPTEMLVVSLTLIPMTLCWRQFQKI